MGVRSYMKTRVHAANINREISQLMGNYILGGMGIFTAGTFYY